MLVNQVREDILAKEIVKKATCECCEITQSKYLYLTKNGICIVLSHVCSTCKYELEIDCALNNYTYQFLSKYKQ